MADKITRIRYAFHRPLVQSEIEVLRLFVGRDSPITSGERVIGCVGRECDVAAFQATLRAAGCSTLHIAVAETAKPHPTIAAAARRISRWHRKERAKCQSR